MRRFVSMTLLIFALSLVAGCFGRSTDPVSGEGKKNRLGEAKDSDAKPGGKGKAAPNLKGGIPND